jgi:hypothetical protein
MHFYIFTPPPVIGLMLTALGLSLPLMMMSYAKLLTDDWPLDAYAVEILEFDVCIGADAVVTAKKAAAFARVPAR